MFEPLGRIEQQHDDLGEIDGPARIGNRQFLELVDHAGTLAHAGGVDQADLAGLVGLGIEPFPVDGDGIAGDPGLGTGQQAVFAQQLVDQRGLAGIGTPDDRQLERTGQGLFIVLGLELGSRFGFFGLGADQRPQAAEQVGHAFAVFGRDAERLSQAQRIAFVNAGLCRLAFGLVGDEHDRHFLLAQPAGDFLVQRGDARTCIDDEQRGIGAFQADLGLLAHAAGKRFCVLVFPACGVDHRKLETRDHGIAHPAVARDAGLVVDQGEFLADQPVEQGGLAHVGPADDDHGRFGGVHSVAASGLLRANWQVRAA